MASGPRLSDIGVKFVAGIRELLCIVPAKKSSRKQVVELLGLVLRGGRS
jgi:hypothetical protein